MQHFNMMNIKSKKLVSLALAIILLVVLLVWVIFKPAKIGMPENNQASLSQPKVPQPGTVIYSAGSPQLSMIKTESIPLTAVPVSDQLSARIAYDDDLTARIGVGFSGRVLEIKVAPGDVVKKGQTLAVIDSPDFGAALADLSKARTDEKRKQLAMKRARDLVPGEAISNRDWEVVQADFAQAQAETARAEQRIKNLNPHDLVIKGQRIILASPMDGIVTERNATPAMELTPGMTAPLFVITNPEKLWLMIDLPESLLGRVKLGSSVNVLSDAFPDTRFEATIIQLGQVINPNTRRANVLARLDNTSGKLLPEMFVRASILQTSGMGVRVPNQAIIIRGLYAYVFVETKPAEFTIRQVTLIRQGTDFSYVGEGLKGEERIVIKGALLLDAEMTARSDDK